MTVLVDTNVLSELRKGPQANEQVRDWDQSISEHARFTSIIVIAELRKGALARMGKDARAGAALDQWVSRVVANFSDRILPVDLRVAEAWARIMVPRSRPPLDALIAATALAHGLTLVTRNVADFPGAGVDVLDPWTFDA